MEYGGVGQNDYKKQLRYGRFLRREVIIPITNKHAVHWMTSTKRKFRRPSCGHREETATFLWNLVLSLLPLGRSRWWLATEMQHHILKDCSSPFDLSKLSMPGNCFLLLKRRKSQGEHWPRREGGIVAPGYLEQRPENQFGQGVC